MTATILIVEDEFLIGIDMQMMLEDAGIRTIGPIATPQEALQQIASERPDAALLDGNLNGHPVDAVAKCLRQNMIPFAFVTGYSRDNLPVGFEDPPVIRKPVAAGILVNAARALFAGQR